MGVVKLRLEALTRPLPRCYNAPMYKSKEAMDAYPLPIARALHKVEQVCLGEDGAACHDAVFTLADALTYYLGAVAVGQYSQALYTDQIEADPTLSRSLRSLRRVLPGQWLLWAARGLAATPDGPVAGLSEWYAQAEKGALTEAYTAVRNVMVERLSYAGEYGPREEVSPRLFLELLDQYRVKLSKTPGNALQPGTLREVADAALSGLRALMQSATFLGEYQLYAPQQRKLLMGQEAATPMPPMHAPEDAAETATLLLYPPGEKPDYTKRPTLQAERLPLFPTDPLLVYLYCKECDTHHVAALREVVNSQPIYQGLDPECNHVIRVE